MLDRAQTSQDHKARRMASALSFLVHFEPYAGDLILKEENEDHLQIGIRKQVMAFYGTKTVRDINQKRQ